MKPAKNLPRSPLSAAQRTAAFLAPRKQSSFTSPINTGPLMVRRGSGVNASH